MARTKTATTAATTAQDLPPLSDADALRRLWRLTLDSAIKTLESGEANASAINVSRQFLADQGIDHRNLSRLDKAVNIDLVNLPSFDD
ncbi:hypothetical protein [Nevskia ramosa]|uniref:hypothetical protein n=1 Tax=Nevskia ramosa TaxID=64002 RepID=UPI0023557672|nr:hypothetical protein [Nevskia ramosa]